MLTHLLAGVVKGSGSGLLRPFIVGNENFKGHLESSKGWKHKVSDTIMPAFSRILEQPTIVHVFHNIHYTLPLPLHGMDHL